MRRKRRAAVFVLAFSLASVLLVASGAPAAAQDFVVQPGESIQAAIDAAPPGSTIVVSPGIYSENLLITKDGITLIGAGPSATFLVAPAPENVQPTPCGELFAGEGEGSLVAGICVFGEINFDTFEVVDPVSDTGIIGFNISGFSGPGVLFLGTTGGHVEANHVSNNGDYGVFALLSSNGRYVANTFASNAVAGLYIGDSPEANSTVTGNHAYDNFGFGIFIRAASHGQISGNNIHDNCWGLLFLTAGGPVSNWDATGNQVNHNSKLCEFGPEDVLTGAGIVVAGASDLNIHGNTVLDNQPAAETFVSGGIVVVSGAPFGGGDPQNVQVVGNVALNNSPDLLWDETGQNIVFQANVCETSVPPGLCLLGPLGVLN